MRIRQWTSKCLSTSQTPCLISTIVWVSILPEYTKTIFWFKLSEIYRQIQQRVLYDLSDISEDYEQIPINFALTSVFDHSIHEAFSRILHRLIGGLPYLEELLNTFCAVSLIRPNTKSRGLIIHSPSKNSHATKAFLFDVRSRIYVATDASPVDAPVHAWCCDYLKLLTSFNRLYRYCTFVLEFA
jgi:Ras-related GTP-binding protein C/D